MAKQSLGARLSEHAANRVNAAPREVAQTLTALIRQGAKDLRDFVLNPWQEPPLAHTEEVGTPGNPTTYEVYQERHPREVEVQPIIPQGRKMKEVER